MVRMAKEYNSEVPEVEAAERTETVVHARRAEDSSGANAIRLSKTCRVIMLRPRLRRLDFPSPARRGTAHRGAIGLYIVRSIDTPLTPTRNHIPIVTVLRRDLCSLMATLPVDACPFTSLNSPPYPRPSTPVVAQSMPRPLSVVPKGESRKDRLHNSGPFLLDGRSPSTPIPNLASLSRTRRICGAL